MRQMPGKLLSYLCFKPHAFMTPRIFFSLFVLVFHFLGQSQKLLDFKPFDTTAYIFKLDHDQVDFIVKRNMIPDTNYLFTHLHKKAALNSNYAVNLPHGNYIVASIYGSSITYQYIYSFSFDIRHKVIGEQVIIFLKDKKTHENLSTAKVSIDQLDVPFDEGFGGYAFDRKQVDQNLLATNRVLLHITLGEEYQVLHYNFVRGYQPPRIRGRVRASHQQFTASGYLVMDKPVYRPGDTLRLKGFLMNPLTGKPFRRHALLSIMEPSQNFYLNKDLKAVSPGAFVYDWKIPDTLKIDRPFQLQLTKKHRSNRFIQTASFYLENYQLNSNTFDAALLKQEFFPGEDLVFTVKAKDAAGFPLQGAMIHYTLRLNAVQDFFGDTMLLSSAKRYNMLEGDTIFPYENALQIRVPHRSLPDIDATYLIDVVITDPATFEQKQFPLYCNRLSRKENLLAYQKEDSLFIRFMLNGKDSPRTYTIVSLSQNDTLFRKIITTPYAMKLSPYNTLVHVLDSQQLVTSVNVWFNALDISKVKGERSADSIHISFSFPFREAIYYRILKNDKVVRQGKTETLSFSLADNTKDPYTIEFTSNINNAIDNNYYRITYQPPLHKIKLKTSIPPQAFPGQKLQVSIQATDCYDKPLEKINIAAFAVNKQFEERFVTPQITVPEMYKDLVSLSPIHSNDQVSLTDHSLRNSYLVSPGSFTRFDLLKNEYYQFRYPSGGMTILKKSIQSPLPEFALCATINRNSYTPKYILLDGAPVYISDLHAYPYSFQAEPGPHEITFRFADKKYTVKNVNFEKGHKYWLGFNLDSIRQSSPNISVVDSLPVIQPNDLEKNLLYNTILLTSQFAYDSLLVSSGHGTVFRSNGAVRRQAHSLNVDGDVFYAFGPLSSLQNASLSLNKKTYRLKATVESAHFYDAASQLFTSKNRGPVKGAFLAFTEQTFSDQYLAELQVPDTVKAKPEAIHLSYDPAAGRSIEEKPAPEYTQRYNAFGPSQVTIFLKNNDKKGNVKALWTISRQKPEESSFMQIYSQSNLQPITMNATEGFFDLYFLLDKGRLVILRNVQFNNGDAFYVNPFLFPAEELNSEKLSEPLKIYSDLTKLPLLPFYFPPDESNESIKETKDARRTKTYLHGYITNQSLQPLANVLVMAEVNGKFLHGAVTNNAGEFEILDMTPGTYQVKLYHASYQIKTFSATFLKAGHSYELSSSLRDLNQQKPMLETITKEFRFMVFRNDKRRDLMKINVYDKDTREALHGFTLTLRDEQTNAVKKLLTAHNDLELAFPKEEGNYKLEFACKGYQSVIFHNLRFCPGCFYALYLFTVSEKTNNQAAKEYNLQMFNCSNGQDHYNHAISNQYTNLGSASYAASPSYSSMDLAPASLEEITVSKRKFSKPRMSRAQHGVTSEEKEASADQASGDNNEGDEKYVSDEMINQAANSDISQLRKNFSDVGYWQPNFLTDKKGNVSFEIRLPDNITTWKSNVLAIGNGHLHGIDTSETHTFKPLQVQTILPPYLFSGDKVWTKAKYSNLTAGEKKISTDISVNGKTLKKNEVLVKNVHMDSVLLSAEKPGTLQYKASLQFEEKYRDQEQKEILIHDPAFRFHENQHLSMDRDTLYQLSIAAGTKAELIFNNSLYEKIREEISELENSGYGSVEHLSSLLKTLLCKENINQATQVSENLNPAIYRLINQLHNYQNKNGSWGWWKKQPANWRMTIYATEALGQAQYRGYSNNAFTKGLQAIKDHYSEMSVPDQLYAFTILRKYGQQEDRMKKSIEQLQPESLHPMDQLYYYKIKEMAGQEVSSTSLYNVYLELNRQSGRFYCGDFFYDPRVSMLTAYNLFAGTEMGKELIQLFHSKLLNGQLENNLNAFGRAALIEALTASVENTSGKPVTAQVIVNDTLKITRFPYRIKSAGGTYKMRHRDATVFVNTSEEKFISQPPMSDSLFKVQTSLLQKGQTTSLLQAGVPCQMKVSLEVYRSFDYAMIEIPVPAGMRFTIKSQQPGVAIEYLNNKVVMFFQKISMGQYQYSFDMVPAFRGSFRWPASKCSLVYYPYLYGNNEAQTVEIRQTGQE